MNTNEMNKALEKIIVDGDEAGLYTITKGPKVKNTKWLDRNAFYSVLKPLSHNIHALLEKYKCKKKVYDILVENGLRPEITLNHFYKFIKTDVQTENKAEVAQVKLKSLGAYVDWLNQLEHINEKSYMKSDFDAWLADNKAPIKGKAVSVNWCQDEAPFIHCPKKLYWLTNDDARYPKYYLKLDENQPSIPWKCKVPILISDEGELYDPYFATPLPSKYSIYDNANMLADKEGKAVTKEKYLTELIELYLDNKIPIRGRRALKNIQLFD